MRQLHTVFCTLVTAIVFVFLYMPSTCNGGILVGPIINPSNGHHYYLVEMAEWSPAGFYASEFEANQLGGHLITIRNAAENDWIFATFGPYLPDGRGIIGLRLNGLQDEGNYVWTSGEAVTYLNWDQDTNPPFGPQPESELDDVVGMVIGLYWATPGTWHDFYNTDLGDLWWDVQVYPLVEVSNPIPEPASVVMWSLLAMAGIGFGWWRRRR